MIWRVFIWRYLCLSCLFSLAFVLAFRLWWLVDFFCFSLSDFLALLGFWLPLDLASFFSLFVAVDITVCVVVVALWLIDFVACFFFPFRLLWFVGFAGFDCFCGFWLLCFLPWLIGVWHLFFALAFALFCLSASVGGSILSVLVLLSFIAFLYSSYWFFMFDLPVGYFTPDF